MTTTVRRTELSEFLRAHRAAVSPADAGLPAGPRRRTPGLRREEVAVLAGVGVSWYQWLEQGRDITVSGQVLDAVARVLRLTDPERRHLYVLAGLNPPLPTEPAEHTLGADITRLLDGWLPNPAHVVDRYWNFVAANASARSLFGWEETVAGNCLVDFFTDELYRARYLHWARVAPTVVAHYRHEMTLHGADDGYTAVLADIAARSTEFAELWSRQEVQPPNPTVKTLLHPRVGELVVEGRMLHLPDRPDVALVLHTPRNAESAARIAELTADSLPLHA